VGRIGSGGGKNKSERLRYAVESYISTACLLLKKVEDAMSSFPLFGNKDLMNEPIPESIYRIGL
jgi:hypothetical protein